MRYVALLRGINVGRAKRVRMSDLRDVFASLGASDTKTLLNSGNVVFTASSRPAPAELSVSIEERTGVASKVTVLTGAEWLRIVDECPLVDVATQPSRLMVAVTRRATDLEPLLERDWAPEALALGTLAAYLWCPDGTMGSALSSAVNGTLADDVTVRNWSTTAKIAAAL